MTTVTTAMAASTPSPLRMTQRARETGVDRTRSRRSSPSSEAQPATNLAPASPMMSEPKLKKASWSRPDGWRRSMPG